MASPEEQGPTAGLVPHLTIGDRRAADAIEFYKKAFGAQEQMRMPADDSERLLHAHLLINGASLLLNDDFPEYRVAGELPAPAGVTLHLQVDNSDRWYDRAVAAGATPTMPLADMFWGDRYGQVRDPFGHTWSIGSPIAKAAS